MSAADRRPGAIHRIPPPTMAARAIIKVVFINSSLSISVPLFVRRRRILTIHGHKTVALIGKNTRCPAQGTLRAGKKEIRSEKRNAARKSAHHWPEARKQKEWKTRLRRCWAKSKPKRRRPGLKADLATDWKPESQGQAATPGRESRRNRPGRNGRNVRRERHRPPARVSGQRASRPATGCKQWPVPFSRFEYHLMV